MFALTAGLVLGDLAVLARAIHAGRNWLPVDADS